MLADFGDTGLDAGTDAGACTDAGPDVGTGAGAGADSDGRALKTLKRAIDISASNVSLWGECLNAFSARDVHPSALFDYIAPLILARCRTEASDCLSALLDSFAKMRGRPAGKRIYWVGYPFWHHPDRCIIPDGGQIVGANYATWWNLDYSGADVWERLYNAYNFTSLNQPHEAQRGRVLAEFERAGADGAIINRNKSCKRDSALFFEKDSPIPCVTIESDMIDHNYTDIQREAGRIGFLMSAI